MNQFLLSPFLAGEPMQVVDGEQLRTAIFLAKIADGIGVAGIGKAAREVRAGGGDDLQLRKHGGEFPGEQLQQERFSNAGDTGEDDGAPARLGTAKELFQRANEQVFCSADVTRLR